MPPPVRWLLSLPDAVEQLERLDRDLITRRDLEELLGVSRSRAAALMRLFGAEMAGTILVLRRASLLRTFQRAIAAGSFRRELDRRDRLVQYLHQARTAAVRVPVVPRRRRAGWTACLPVSRSSLAASRSVSSNLVMRSPLFMLLPRLFWPTTTVSRTSSAVDLQTGSSGPGPRSFRCVRRPAAGRRGAVNGPARVRPASGRRGAGHGPVARLLPGRSRAGPLLLPERVFVPVFLDPLGLVLSSSCVGGRVSAFTTSSRRRRPCRSRFG